MGRTQSAGSSLLATSTALGALFSDNEAAIGPSSGPRRANCRSHHSAKRYSLSSRHRSGFPCPLTSNRAAL
jgi:hypothetical protein